jgi:hypothetical protein
VLGGTGREQVGMRLGFYWVLWGLGYHFIANVKTGIFRDEERI